MITCIREVRRKEGLTLHDVAARCVPPTTAQTIGRLETGTRTVSVGWLNRIAAALGVTAAELVRLPDQAELPLAAKVGASGAHACSRDEHVPPPTIEPGMVGVRVVDAAGDYLAGDLLWCLRLSYEKFDEALDRDVLAPLPAGRFVFGKLVAQDGVRLTVLPAGDAEPQIVEAAAWLAVARRLVRAL